MTATTAPAAGALASGTDRRDLILGWIGLAARLILGVVLIWAGGAKLPNLEESVLAVRAYKILPYDATAAVGYALPIVEVIVGILLVIGLFTRVVGAIGALLMAAFIVGISWAWAHGYAIDCGCFGGGGQIAWEEAQAKYPWEIARDIGLFLCGAFLVWRPRTPYSVDAWLFRPVSIDDLDLTDGDLADDSEETPA